MSRYFSANRRLLGSLARSTALIVLIAVLTLAGGLSASQATTASSLAAPSAPVLVSGNIAPNSIEIDANLYQNGSLPNVDWVKDNLNNVGTNCLSGSVASCNEANVTAATGGTGHWWGARIVDGLNQGDQDIFRTGGKENDTSTWNVGPGSVGSAKYDISQAYLANNQTTLFFGMERSGNNGTTAFDFEFNQAAPAGTYVPTRTVGDILFTFEMQGSGGSGSATPHYFVWNGSTYAEQVPPPAGLVSTINNAAIPAAPWGTVDSHGNWILGNIDRFEFAEAKAPLSLLPGVNPCGGAAYVQVRTRSSSTASSDLKDTTKIFQYQFGGPTPAGSLTAGCGPAFSYDGSQSRDSQGGTNLTYSWVFTTPLGVTLSGGGVSGSNGIYHATQVTGTVDVGGLSGASPASIAAQLTVSEGGTCPTTAAPVSVDVYPAPTASAAKTSADGSAFSVLLTGSSNYSNGAGPAGASFQWQKWNGSAWVDISGATGTTLTYSGFESDATPTSTTFSIGGDSYAGQLWSVQLRLHVAHTANGATCDAYSAAVTVKKVKAVDP